jgi:hypothetical protein
MQFTETLNPHGHLEIWKHYPDGNKELHFKDDNVICSGMGATLAEMFDADPAIDVENYQCIYFRCGSGGALEANGNPGTAGQWQVSGTSDINRGYLRSQYGTGNLDMSLHNIIQNGAQTGPIPFGVIPYSYIKRVTPTKCMWQIVLDEQTLNVGDETPEGFINEIGLYSKNPYVEATDASMLCAYRYFKKIYKTDAFILVFRWTIEF